MYTSLPRGLTASHGWSAHPGPPCVTTLGVLHVFPWSVERLSTTRKPPLIHAAYTSPFASVSICGSYWPPRRPGQGQRKLLRPNVFPSSLETFKTMYGYLVHVEQAGCPL